MKMLAVLVALLLLDTAVADGQCDASWRREENMNYINRDVSKAQTVTKGADECCALCVKVKGCTVWSLVQEGKLCRFRSV
jgi:hypothetical protein